MSKEIFELLYQHQRRYISRHPPLCGFLRHLNFLKTRRNHHHRPRTHFPDTVIFAAIDTVRLSMSLSIHISSEQLEPRQTITTLWTPTTGAQPRATTDLFPRDLPEAVQLRHHRFLFDPEEVGGGQGFVGECWLPKSWKVRSRHRQSRFLPLKDYLTAFNQHDWHAFAPLQIQQLQFFGSMTSHKKLGNNCSDFEKSRWSFTKSISFRRNLTEFAATAGNPT